MSTVAQFAIESTRILDPAGKLAGRCPHLHEDIGALVRSIAPWS